MQLFVLPIFDGVIMDEHPIFKIMVDTRVGYRATQNIGCPSITTPSKMGKTINVIFNSLMKIQNQIVPGMEPVTYTILHYQ